MNGFNVIKSILAFGMCRNWVCDECKVYFNADEDECPANCAPKKDVFDLCKKIYTKMETDLNHGACDFDEPYTIDELIELFNKE